MNPLLWLLRGLAAALLTVGITFLKTPLWLYDIVKRERPTKEYPNGIQIYLTFIARTFLRQLTLWRAQPAPSTRQPSKLRDSLLFRRFSWVDPAPLATTSSSSGNDEKSVGITFDSEHLPLNLEEDEAKKKTAGLWYLNPKEPGTIPTESKPRKSRVLLYFHGGAYITLEAGDMFMGLTLARMKAKYAEIDVFSINYRLAPDSKHPSQIFEAFSAWRHLRRLGYEKIFIGGDSAGANLALCLWRYLNQIALDSGPVQGLILHSPWLDMAGFKAMQKSNIPDPKDGWISPICWTQDLLVRLPPVLVTHGGIETLLEEGEIFVDGIRKAGGQVEHIVTAGHPHDFTAIWWFAPSVRRLFLQVHDWINKIDMSGEA